MEHPRGRVQGSVVPPPRQTAAGAFWLASVVSLALLPALVAIWVVGRVLSG